MTMGLCFYILMLLWLFFGVVPTWPSGENASYRVFGGSLLLFVLLLLLGWHAFGAPIHG